MPLPSPETVPPVTTMYFIARKSNLGLEKNLDLQEKGGAEILAKIQRGGEP